MSKKKHPEHVNHERWLVSYADFITLLFAFFVVLFASGQTDKRKTVKLAQSMQAAFSFNGVFDPHTRTPPISDDGGASSLSSASPLTLPIPAAANEQSQQTATVLRIREVIQSQVARHQLKADSVNLHATPEGLVLSLREAGFFDSGSANLRDQSLAVFSSVAAALPHQAMRVEGHTDDVPIHTAQFASNWELSTARAATITRLLIAQRAADPMQISACGYAEFHPATSNLSEQGRAQNRRVDIVLLKTVPSTAMPR